MNTAQLLRIFLALALIFAAGVFTGRYTAPRPAPVAAGGGRTTSVDEMMARLTAELRLDSGQREKVSDVIEDAAEQMMTMPTLSPQRREVLRACVPKIRAVLRPDQYAALDQFVELAERRMARMMRRREAMLSAPGARGSNSSVNGLPIPKRPAP